VLPHWAKPLWANTFRKGKPKKRREEEKKRERGRERGSKGEKDSTRKGKRGTSRTVCPGWAPKGEDLDTKRRETTENYETHTRKDSEAPSSREKDQMGEEPCCEPDSMPRLTAGQRMERR